MRGSISMLVLGLWAAVCPGNFSGNLFVGASVPRRRCFIDTVWDADELYHDFGHQYGAAWNPETNQTEKLNMDFYAPPPAEDHRAKRPTVVLVHGGSFVAGDKSSWRPLATALARRGFIVGSINYRLTGKHWGAKEYCCPGNTSDQYAIDAVHDARAAVRYLRKMANGSAWRLDPERIGIGGGSAGAVTVLFYGYADRAATEGNSGSPGYSSKVRFVMPVSGELRYDAFCHGPPDPVTGEPTGCHYGSWDYTDQINATRHPEQPPLLIVHGTADTIVPFREAQAMLAQANATGLPHSIIAIPGAGHVPQQQLISGFLQPMLAFIIDSMDLANAECPTKPGHG